MMMDDSGTLSRREDKSQRREAWQFSADPTYRHTSTTRETKGSTNTRRNEREKERLGNHTNDGGHSYGFPVFLSICDPSVVVSAEVSLFLLFLRE